MKDSSFKYFFLNSVNFLYLVSVIALFCFVANEYGAQMSLDQFVFAGLRNHSHRRQHHRADGCGSYPYFATHARGQSRAGAVLCVLGCARRRLASLDFVHRRMLGHLHGQQLPLGNGECSHRVYTASLAYNT